MSRRNGISVEDMLELDVMGKSRLIAGFKGANNTIARVNMVADPDIFDWIKEGEFLLTTAYFFEKDDIESQKKLIIQAANKDLAGIGIKIYPYLDSLPKEIINLANKLNVPLVDIHHSIPLSDIMMFTFQEIFEKQAILLGRIESVHERFMEVMLEGQGIENIVQVIQENIQNPVVLKLNFFEETFVELGDRKESVKKEILEDVDNFYKPNNGKGKLKRLDEDNVLINGRFVKRMVMPIVLKDNIYGHIFAWSIDTPLGGFDLSIIESASTTAALAILQELSVKDVEIRYRSEFFEDLISKDSKRKRKALERAHFFNLRSDDYYIIEVMSIKLEVGDGQENEQFFEYLEDCVNNTVIVIEDMMDYLNLNGIVSTKYNGIQILLGFQDKKDIDYKLKNFNDQVVKIIEQRFNNMDIRIGAGRYYQGLENVNKSFADAVKAVRIGKLLTDRNIITFDELGIFKILGQDFLIEELKDFYKTTLKPLVDYDRDKSTELVKTLEAYFQFNGNLSRSSEYLYTHYNTILYRIERIKQITGMDLDNPNDRLNLEIALKISKLL